MFKNTFAFAKMRLFWDIFQLCSKQGHFYNFQPWLSSLLFCLKYFLNIVKQQNLLTSVPKMNEFESVKDTCRGWLSAWGVPNDRIPPLGTTFQVLPLTHNGKSHWVKSLRTFCKSIVRKALSILSSPLMPLQSLPMPWTKRTKFP